MPVIEVSTKKPVLRNIKGNAPIARSESFVSFTILKIWSIFNDERFKTTLNIYVKLSENYLKVISFFEKLNYSIFALTKLSIFHKPNKLFIIKNVIFLK